MYTQHTECEKYLSGYAVVVVNTFSVDAHTTADVKMRWTHSNRSVYYRENGIMAPGYEVTQIELQDKIEQLVTGKRQFET